MVRPWGVPWGSFTQICKLSTPQPLEHHLTAVITHPQQQLLHMPVLLVLE